MLSKDLSLESPTFPHDFMWAKSTSDVAELLVNEGIFLTGSGSSLMVDYNINIQRNRKSRKILVGKRG